MRLFVETRCIASLDEEIEQKVNDMPITYDIKTDSFYNRGIQEGIQKGIRKGREEGIEKTKNPLQN